MTDAPERIWAVVHEHGAIEALDYPVNGVPEYVRADLYAALETDFLILRTGTHADAEAIGALRDERDKLRKTLADLRRTGEVLVDPDAPMPNPEAALADMRDFTRALDAARRALEGGE